MKKKTVSLLLVAAMAVGMLAGCGGGKSSISQDGSSDTADGSEKVEMADAKDVDGLHPAVYHVKMADFLKEYLDSGLNVRVWTVNEKEDMEWLIRAGVTAIITNYPDKAVQIKEKVEA